MNNLRVSPQTITLFIVGLSLLPRFFSEYAFQNGTVVILIFWIAPLVLFSEFIKGYSTEKIQIQDLHISLKLFLGLCTIVIICTFWCRHSIYSDDYEKFKNLRRILYLIHPMIYLSWFSSVDKKHFKKFISICFILTIGMTLAMAIPLLLSNSKFGDDLNILTAKCSASIYSLFSGVVTQVESRFFYNDNFSIKVGGGCSSTPQICIALFSITSMQLCCKIKSSINIIIVTFSAILISFTINIFRVSMLGYYISIKNLNTFDFWHDGGGSFIFSFVTMFVTSTIFYFFWSRENPIK